MKKTWWNHIGRLVSRCPFSKWHKDSDLFMLAAVSNHDLCARHYVVTASAWESSEEAQTASSTLNFTKKTKLNLFSSFHWKFLCHHTWRKASSTCLNRSQNKPTFTNNTHKKSVNVDSGLLSHLFFFIKQLFSSSLVSGWNQGGKKEGEWWDISASLWQVKVSLLTWWLVHSADVTWSLSRGSHLSGRSCRGPASLPSSGSCVTGRTLRPPFHPDLLLHLPLASRGPVWLEPEEKTADSHRVEIQSQGFEVSGTTKTAKTYSFILLWTQLC